MVGDPARRPRHRPGCAVFAKATGSSAPTGWRRPTKNRVCLISASGPSGHRWWSGSEWSSDRADNPPCLQVHRGVAGSLRVLAGSLALLIGLSDVQIQGICARWSNRRITDPEAYGMLALTELGPSPWPGATQADRMDAAVAKVCRLRLQLPGTSVKLQPRALSPYSPPGGGIEGCHTAPGLREPALPLSGRRPWRSCDHYFPCRRQDVWHWFITHRVFPWLRWLSALGPI
jgi:hypothetical protein